jgi:Bacterial antitoxin of type II TA system, VapB
MLVCMRTSMNLPDALLEQARAHATATGRTVTSLVEEALRKLLAEHSVEARTPRVALTTDGMPDGRLLIDVTDREALWAELDRA